MNKKKVGIVFFSAIFLLLILSYFLGVFTDKSFSGVINRFEKPYEIILNKIFSGENLTRTKIDVFAERIGDLKDDLSFKGTLDLRVEPFTADINGKVKFREKDPNSGIYNVKIPNLPLEIYLNSTGLSRATLGWSDLPDYFGDINGKWINYKRKISDLHKLAEELKYGTIFELIEELSDKKYFRYNLKMKENIFNSVKSLDGFDYMENDFTLEILRSNENIYKLENDKISIISTKKGINFNVLGENLFTVKKKGLRDFVIDFGKTIETFEIFHFSSDSIKVHIGSKKTVLESEFENRHFLKIVLEKKKIDKIREN